MNYAIPPPPDEQNSESERVMPEEDCVRFICTKIGRFAVEFEAARHTIDIGIRCILAKEGLENDQIYEILSDDLTLKPLTVQYHSLSYGHLRLDTEAYEIIDYIFSTLRINRNIIGAH